jgi:hypothetical protein
MLSDAKFPISTYIVSLNESPIANLNPALKPLLTLYLMIMKITGPTESDRNNPSPNPAMNDVSMCLDEINPKLSARSMINIRQESKEILLRG